MKFLCAFFFVLFVLGSGALADRRKPGRHGDRRGRMFTDLNPQEPRVELENDGGKLEAWGGRGSGVFEDANVAACRTTLKQRGLWLPSYVDSPSLHVVTQGSGRVGIISSFTDRRSQENTFKVEKGDVVAVPEGHVIWWYNDEQKDLEIIGAADVTEGTRPAGLRAFHLAGGKQQDRQRREDRREEEERGEQDGYGAVIHGFSTEVLGRAWEMDKQSVEKLLEQQSESGIVRVDKDIRFPDSGRPERDNPFFLNFIYRFAKVHPDLRVENGGELRELNSFKLPVLKYVGLGMECMKLEKGAMVAPNWFQNGHQVLYVFEGRGKIEAVYNNGEKALETELEEGSLVVIPAFFPSTKIAARDERFHYITFVTSDKPIISYLSGRNSAYRGIPRQVLSRMLNVDEQQAEQIQHAHGKQSVIFPADESSEDYERKERGRSDRGRHEDREQRKRREDEEQRKRREDEDREERKRREEERDEKLIAL